jgi:hypothetical protein
MTVSASTQTTAKASTAIAGYCDHDGGECITTDTGIPPGTTVENVAHGEDEISTLLDDSENRRAGTAFERK